MDALIKIIRWALLVFFVALGLLYLNGAASAWWASWGPPTKYPESWQQAAFVRLGFAISAFCIGVIIFMALKKGFSFKSSQYKFYSLIAAVILSLSYPQTREWFLIDTCLDSGGTWQNNEFRCKK